MLFIPDRDVLNGSGRQKEECLSGYESVVDIDALIQRFSRRVDFCLRPPLPALAFFHGTGGDADDRQGD
jgi:hypothetical protein